MEDLSKKTEDLVCEMCSGINTCRCCGEMFPTHSPEYVYRILIQLAKYQIPADELLEFVHFIDERKLWQEIGHWTICGACEDLRIDLKDYAIHHHRVENRNTLEVWQGKDEDRMISYAESELAYSTTWISEPPMISDETERRFTSSHIRSATKQHESQSP